MQWSDCFTEQQSVFFVFPCLVKACIHGGCVGVCVTVICLSCMESVFVDLGLVEACIHGGCVSVTGGGACCVLGSNT